MNRRTLLILLVGILISFTIVVVSLLGVYKYLPEFLESGQFISSDSIETDTLYIEPVLTITQEQLDDFQRKLINKEVLKKQKDSLEITRENLLDSMKLIEKNISKLLDSLNKTHEKLGENKQFAGSLKDSISKLQKSFQSAQKKLVKADETVKNQKERMEKKADTNQMANLMEFTKIYEKSNPEEVAKIIEQISEKDAAVILKNMKTKKAGKILEALPPEKGSVDYAARWKKII